MSIIAGVGTYILIACVTYGVFAFIDMDDCGEIAQRDFEEDAVLGFLWPISIPFMIATEVCSRLRKRRKK